MSTILEESKANVKTFNLSYSHTYKQTTNTTKSLAHTISESWSPPSIVVVHWDGKLMATLDGYSKEERLPVLVSGNGDTKLLGVPCLKKGKSKSGEKTGDKISHAVAALLEKWQCKKNVIGMVFDTTASNTGHKSGACIAIQRDLKKPLLWVACRHHVGEVVLSHVWKGLKIEMTQGPCPCMFTKFKHHWSTIVDKGNHNIDLTCYSGNAPTELLAFYRKILQEDFPRDDYREMVKLSLIYLGEHQKTDEFRLQKPSSFSNARWMSKVLLGFKIVMLHKRVGSRLPEDAVLSADQLEKLTRFVNFCVFVYNPWWLTATKSSNAPHDDFLLIKRVSEFSESDQQCSESANHLWYLNEETVPFSLFSENVDSSVKDEIGKRILSTENEENFFKERYGNSYGKPRFPQIQDIVSARDISVLVGPSSWSLLKIIGCSASFLKKPVIEWSSDEEFLKAAAIVNNLPVVNDAAERGVKLCHDFLDTARKEDNLQNILQVVESERKAVSSQRKCARREKKWFLQHQTSDD